MPQNLSSERDNDNKENEDPWVPTGSQSSLFDRDTKIWIKNRRTFFAACTASIVSTFVAYPLDTMKARLQAFPTNGFVDCARSMYLNEGVRSFWRGSMTPLVSISIVRTCSMSVYQVTKYFLDARIGQATGVSPLAQANTREAPPSLGTVACFGGAGAAAGACASILGCPFELTKFNSQVAAEAAKAAFKHSSFEATSGDSAKSAPRAPAVGFFGTVNWIVKHHGVMGLYSGYRFHLIRDTLGTSVYFATYETSKQLLANGRGKSPTEPLPVFVAGGLCGVVSFACVYPVDSAKSIYQRNVLFGKPGHNTKPEMPKVQFFNARMYRGLSVSALRTSLVNAIFFSVFEKVKKEINRLKVDDKPAE